MISRVFGPSPRDGSTGTELGSRGPTRSCCCTPAGVRSAPMQRAVIALAAFFAFTDGCDQGAATACQRSENLLNQREP